MARHPERGVLAAVARAAGVSSATVSKVVHRRRDVSPETREKVEQLLRSHGYLRLWEPHPNRLPNIFAIFRDLSSPYTLEVARGIVTAAAAEGAVTTIGTTEVKSLSQWLDVCSSQDATGVIIIISMLLERDRKRVVEERLPVVVIDPLQDPGTGIPSVGTTNWAGARDAIKYLVSLGHRRIAILAGRPSSLAGGARLHGYRAGLAEAGIEVDDRLVCATDFDYEEAVEAALALLGSEQPPTAIFAASDAQALGVLEAARQSNYTVPQDLSVVSFDDTAAAATACPPLTAVRQPFAEIGVEATRVLLQLASGQPLSAHRIELATTLTVRQSTAPPRVDLIP